MTPFFFGARQHRLFGIYAPAGKTSLGKRAAVLCHPLGTEYTYAHRALRVLAGRLSAAGFHTLRFDYFGTGDSGGDMLDARLAGWEADIELAIDELGAIADIRSIALVGLRLGATLAAGVAARCPNMVDALILWDPVASGTAYVDKLAPALLPTETAADAEATGTSGDAFNVLGCVVGRSFLDELRAIELAPRLAAATCRRLAILTNPPEVPAPLQPLVSEPGVRFEILAAVAPWTEPAATAGLLPAAVIQRIVGWLE